MFSKLDLKITKPNSLAEARAFNSWGRNSGTDLEPNLLLKIHVHVTILTQKDLPSLLASLTNPRTKHTELCINAAISNIKENFKKKTHTQSTPLSSL